MDWKDQILEKYLLMEIKWIFIIHAAIIIIDFFT